MSIRSGLFSILSGLLVVLNIGYFVEAGDPKAKKRLPVNEIWETKLRDADGEYLYALVFLSNGVIAELRKYADSNDGTLSTGFIQVDGNKIQIEWARIEHGKLVIHSKENGVFSKTQDPDVRKYKIIDHTDRTQIGTELELRRSSLPDREFAGLLELSNVLDRLRTKQMDDERLLNVYREQIADYERGIKMLLGK